MKEVTYEDWQKNPTPRMMWVWDEDENSYVIRKVVYIVKESHVLNRVITIDDDESDFDLYKHCAEVGNQRRMTNKEFSHWLREKPTREYKYRNSNDNYIYGYYEYKEQHADEEVTTVILIREDDGEWREPLVEE